MEPTDLDRKLAIALELPLAPYSRLIESAWLVEAEIAKRGLQVSYAKELQAVVDPTDIACHRDGKWLGWYMVFCLVHATPEQRCRAAIAALKEAK